jgi:hypothetical protein
MKHAIFHRLAVPAISLIGIALWAAPTLAAPESFKVALTGAQQSPAVQTPGMGTANLTYDPATRVVTWTISYSALSGPVTMAHFHGPAEAGKNGGVQIWLTKQGSPADSPITGTATLTPEQATQFTAGQWYINLHTQAHPGGEIRAQVMPPKS